MLISDYLKEDCIRVGLTCSSKDEVLKTLAELQFNAHPDVDRDETIDSLYEREELLSTGIGDGIAIPHARIDSSEDVCVSIGLLSSEVDFNALDNKPVWIVFLILFPKEKVNLQLRFLARVSRILQNSTLREELYKCESAGEVMKVFKAFEEKHVH